MGGALSDTRTGTRRPGRGLGYAPGGAGANGAPSVAFGHVAHDGPGGHEVGLDIDGNGSAGNPFTASSRQVNNIMTSSAVASWASPMTGLWQIICGDCPASMQRAVVRGYVGATVNISVGAHGMLEALDDVDFLAFTSRGGAGINFPLAQHLSSLGYAIVTIASRGLPQDGADFPVALAREKLGGAFSAEDTILNDHVMEHFAAPIARRTGSGWRLW